MAINIITGFFSNSREQLDKRSGPYDSTASALAALNTNQRVIGMPIYIVSGGTQDGAGNYISGDVTAYSFDGGIADGDLQPIVYGTDSNEYIESSGTRAGGDLVVTIGDYDDSNSGTKIILDDGGPEIGMFADAIKFTGTNSGIVEVEAGDFQVSVENDILFQDGNSVQVVGMDTIFNDGGGNNVTIPAPSSGGSLTVNLPTTSGDLALTSDIVDTIFDSSLSPTLAMASPVGNVSAGTTIADLQGLTFTQYLELQNFPTVFASIVDAANLAVTGFNNSSVEVGTDYSATLTVAYDTGIINNGDGSAAGPVTGDALTFVLTDPSTSTDYTNPSVTGNSDTGVALSTFSLTQGTNTWVVSGTNSVGTTTYTDNKGGTATVPAIEAAKADTTPNSINLSKTAFFPLFYGMSATDDSAGGTALYSNADLTKEVANTSSRSIALTGTNEFIYFAYPASFGDLNIIIDGNGFDVTSSFTKFTVNVTSVGFTSNWTESYNIYKTNSVTSVAGQTFQFNF